MASINSLKDLLIDELRDLYSAETQLVKALPKMAKAASNDDLKQGILAHLEETRGHVDRLDRSLRILGASAKGKTCHAVAYAYYVAVRKAGKAATAFYGDKCAAGKLCLWDDVNYKDRRKEFEERAKKLLASVGLGGMEKKFPWELSGGMQQRASICRALIHEPKMLLLDEPFGALDAFTREELWCILRDLQAEQGFNVILVTHDLRESVFLADTVYVMSKSPGRFVVRREIGFPRPRDLALTYTPEFTDIVLELRGHIGAMRHAPAGGAAIHP